MEVHLPREMRMSKTIELNLTDNSICILKAALKNWKESMYKIGNDYDNLEMEHNAYEHCDEAQLLIDQISNRSNHTVSEEKQKAP